MANLSHYEGIVDSYSFVLSTADHRHLGQLTNIDDSSVTVKCNLNSADEISFDVYKEIETNGTTIVEANWDKIIPLKYIYCVELDEYFVIDVQLDDKKQTLIKSITGSGAGEMELSNINIYGLEVNSDEDIDRDDYVVTYFYNTDANKSLLNRALDRAPQWSVGHVDGSLKNLQRTFSVDGTDIYSFLTGDVAEQFNCMFILDSVERTINAYDLYTVCKTCGYRGDYDNECPECGSTDLDYYGEDTLVYVDSANLTEDVQLTTDTDSIKNCFHLTAGDDEMNSAIMLMNPNGSRYITYFSEETLDDMPDELVEKLNTYDKDYDYYSNTYSMEFDSSLVSSYNTVVDKYKTDYYNFTYNTVTEEGTELSQMITPLVGYENLTKYYYEASALRNYLKSEQMPTSRSTSSQNINSTTEAEAVNEAYTKGIFSSIGTKIYSSSTTRDYAENAIKQYAKAFVKSGYVTVDVEKDGNGKSTASWSAGSSSGTWTGRLLITNASDDEDYTLTNTFSITISADGDAYNSQAIIKKIMANQSTKDGSLFDPLGYCSLYYKTTSNATPQFLDQTAEYTEAIKSYCVSRLESFSAALNAALIVLQDTTTNCSDIGKSTLQSHYTNLVTITNAELSLRTQEQDKADRLIDAITAKRTMIRTLLNMEYYLNNAYTSNVEPYSSVTTYTAGALWYDSTDEQAYKYDGTNWNTITLAEYNAEYATRDLFKTFCIYRREDAYSNDNYVSDSLTQQELFDNAKDFLKKANEELKTAATPQHSISSTLYNLFLMDEFQPLRTKFKLGNWIRVRAGDEVYRLRLISYTFNWGGMTTISTEFSDVTIAPGIVNDIQSVLSQASSLAGSYSYTATQANKGATANKTIEKWVESGLSSALVNISNNNEEEVTIDSNGIWARTWDDIEEAYNPEQFRITHNILAFTEDGWTTVSTALGEQDYTYYDADTNTWKSGTGYGLNAKFVQAGYINGSVMTAGHIYSSNYDSSSADVGTHINLEDGTFQFGGSNGLRYDGTKFRLGNGLTADKDGNVTFSGNLSGASGTFSGTLSGASGTFSGTLSGASFSGGSININNMFTVDEYGNMNASSGTFSGSVYSSSGTIGGWTIGSSALTGGYITLNSSGSIQITGSDGNTSTLGSSGITFVTTGNTITDDSDTYSNAEVEIISGSYRTGISGSCIRVGGYSNSSQWTAMTQNHFYVNLRAGGTGGLYFKTSDTKPTRTGIGMNWSLKKIVVGDDEINTRLQGAYVEVYGQNGTSHPILSGELSGNTLTIYMG